MRPDRHPRAASISDGRLGILPMSWVGIATVGALPESVRRSHGARAVTQQRTQIYLIAGPLLERTLFCGIGPVPRAQRCLTPRRFEQAHDFRRSTWSYYQESLFLSSNDR